MSASEVLSEILVLPIEVILKMVFNKLPDIMIASKLAHQYRNAESFLVSKLSIHVFVVIGEGVLEVVAKN